MSNISQLHGWQSFTKGAMKSAKEPKFQEALKYLLSTELTHKDIHRIADVVKAVKEQKYTWYTEHLK